MGEDLQQHAAVQRVGHQVGARHAALDGQRGMLQEVGGVLVQFPARQQGVGIHARQLGVDGAVAVEHAGLAGQEDQFLGA
ncbi:Uncharacterised protein [Bordetella pertussis]|nr:Uncharacterised protein [Bordetella pertussis]